MNAPRVGVVGPLLGHHPGWVVSQGERLAELLAGDGLEVLTASGSIGRAARAVDTVRSVRSWRGRVDVVVVMVFSGPAFVLADVAARTARSIGVPVVLWLHGGNLPDFARRHPHWVHAVRRRADAVVAPSRYLVATVDPPSVVIANVLATSAAPFATRAPLRPRVLWMRTFHELYRPEWAVDVVDRLVERVPDLSLTMAGQDKGGLASVQAAARAAGLGERIEFAGFLGAEAKAAAFADHDLFLNTTATDNAPVSLLEAAAHSVPIVSTAVGGIPDLFPDREAALLADAPDGLADAVATLLADPALATSLSATAHEVAAASTWERVGRQWHDLLASVAAAGRA